MKTTVGRTGSLSTSAMALLAIGVIVLAAMGSVVFFKGGGPLAEIWAPSDEEPIPGLPGGEEPCSDIEGESFCTVSSECSDYNGEIVEDAYCQDSGYVCCKLPLN